MILKKEKFLHYHGRSREESLAAAQFVQKHWQNEVKHRIRIADEVTQHKFLFDLPWDMERTVEMVDFGEKINWFYMPGDDPEFIYQLNRHRYWICLGQAYQITGDEKYAEAFADQLTDWVKESPLTEESKPTTWRTIETGLRAECWLKAMGYMAQSPAVTDEVWEAFGDSLLVHGEHLYACNVPFSIKSNWGVLENNGLYMIGKLLEHCTEGETAERGKEFARLALQRLKRQIDTQVMDDGVHWEQSPMYHNEVLKCYLEVLRIAGKYGETLPKDMVAKIKAMAYADKIWQRPDGCQPAEGDSDVTDVRDILSVCAYIFRDPVLKSGGFEVLDYEGCWDYGMEAAKEYEAIEAKESEDTFVWLKESGNWYLRSGWDEKADYLHVRSGGLGGGHGHFDKLHFELMIDGEDIFTDPGRFTYVDGTDRRRFKSARGHNVLLVDNEEYTKCLDSWGVAGLQPPVNGAAARKGDYTYIQCAHLGYIEKGIFVNRRILAIGTKTYIIADEFYGNGTHTYSQHFHLAAGKNAEELTDNSFTVSGAQRKTRVVCLSDGVRSSAEEFGVSVHYNQMEEGQLVSFERTAEGSGSMVTVITGEDSAEVRKAPVIAGGNGRTLSDREADGIALTIQGRTYAAVFAHVEIGSDCEYIGCMDRYGLGRVMICETEKDDVMTVVSWQ